MKEKILDILLAAHVSGEYHTSDAQDKLVALVESECERARGEALDEVYAMAAEVFDPMPFEGEAVSWYKRTRASFFSRLVSLTHTKL